MMRYLAYVCAFLLSISAVHAQDTGELLKKAGNYLDSVAAEMAENEKNGKNKSDNESKLNAFGVPETIVAVKENKEKNLPETKVHFPDCEDARLLAEIRRLVNERQIQRYAENIHQYRRQHLIAKNMGAFVRVDNAEFKPQDNYEVADRMITLKINEQLPADAFQICRGNNSVIGREVFLLMYPKDGGIVVELLNFSQSEPLRFTVQ